MLCVKVCLLGKFRKRKHPHTPGESWVITIELLNLDDILCALIKSAEVNCGEKKAASLLLYRRYRVYESCFSIILRLPGYALIVPAVLPINRTGKLVFTKKVPAIIVIISGRL